MPVKNQKRNCNFNRLKDRPLWHVNCVLNLTEKNILIQRFVRSIALIGQSWSGSKAR